MTLRAIVGAGALGREVSDSLLASDGVLVPMFDDAPVAPGVQPLRALGAGASILLCVASPIQREALWQRLAPGIMADCHVSSRAYVANSAVFDFGHIILPGACISCDADIGRCCVIGFNSTVGHDVRMGSFCTLSSQVDLCGRVVLGDRVFIGSGARVLPGVQVGDDAYIGAGSVVVKDVAPGARVFGNPAKAYA